MHNPINFAALAEALLSRAHQLVAAWLPGGVQRGHEYVCGSLYGGEGSSLSVNLNSGRWADFASDEKGGDLISLYAAVFGLEMGKAALEVARAEGLEDVAGVSRGPGDTAPRAMPVAPPKPAAPPKEPEGWVTVRPVPPMAPAPTYRHQYRSADDITHRAEYRVGDDLHGYVVRFKTSDGGKETLPYTWCCSAKDGASRWHWRQFDQPRPLYLPGHALPGERTVVLVEGEKKAEVLQALLDAGAPSVYCVASWPGGSKAWKLADWSWLAGQHVLAWPDCDGKRVRPTKAALDACADEAERDVLKGTQPLLPVAKQPGMAAMLGIGALLRDAHGCVVQLLPIPEPLTVPDGWDCADAILTDGWDFERVLAFFGRAYALPQVDGDEASTAHSDKPVGKKIDSPVGTESGDKGDAWLMIKGRAAPEWLRPYWDADKLRWLVSRKLVIKALECDEYLEPVLVYNELSNTVQARVPWPWPTAKAGDVGAADDLMLGNYLTETYGFPSIARAALAEGIQTVANKRRYHPIREYLLGLKWDGKGRIDKWLMHILGETPETVRPAMAEYLQLVGRCWLLGMVYRVMEPGCKFDYAPVLEGAGGLRKSTLVEVLASTPYFSDTPFEVGRGKEAQEQVQGLWLYEISELSHFSKADVGAIKAFISSKMDRYRAAYASTVTAFPRQCVLVGTTNENTYLRDRSGNRRFWPIPARNRINTEWLMKYRDQLLAEAYALYQKGAPCAPTPEQEDRLFKPMQESRLVETAVMSELLHVLTRQPMATGIQSIVNELTEFVTIAQLTQALGVDAAKSSPTLEGQIRGWLDHEGWKRAKKQINGARAWGYIRPVKWPHEVADTDMVEAPPGDTPDAQVEQDEQEGDDAPF